MFEKTRQFCDSFLNLGMPGFDLAVYQSGKCVLRYQGGYSDRENEIAMNGRERYNIYSCSKVITCTAAMQLWEQGRFSLEDPLADYMPEFREMTVRCGDEIRKAEKPILIRHLFEMTAGFSYNCSSPQMQKAKEETEGRCPTREVMRYLAKEPLLFEPGDRWEYSLCHDVLAALVEVISGEKFETYVKKHIFDPLGMQDSTFMLPPEELDTLASQYKYANGQVNNIGKQISSYKIGSEYASGGAGCISTVDDYIRFLEGLRTHAILKPETLRLMTTDRLSEQQKRTYWTKETHGYGLGVRCPMGDARYIDFGWGGAACAYLAVDMENEISLYFGAHMLSSPAAGLRSRLYGFIRAEMLNPAEFAPLGDELRKLHNYTLTY